MNTREFSQSELACINWAKTIIGPDVVINRVASSPKNSVYGITGSEKEWYLKIGADLKAEQQRLDWLKGKLPVPEVTGFTNIEGKDALLMTAITGQNLASLAKVWGPEKVVSKLVVALQRFHSTETKDWPFSEQKPGDVLLHGDACLPNFVYLEDNLSGYIDLGDLQVGEKEVDLAAAIWTLQYNFGPGYGVRLLQEYGLARPTEELAEELRLRYEATI